MPVVSIWRDASKIDDPIIVKVRDAAHASVAARLKVEMSEVALRISQVGPLDVNYSTIGIEIDTGPGTAGWRQEQKVELAKGIADDIARSEAIPREYLGLGGSDVWLRILGGGSFVPIGQPELAR